MPFVTGLDGKELVAGEDDDACGTIGSLRDISPLDDGVASTRCAVELSASSPTLRLFASDFGVGGGGDNLSLDAAGRAEPKGD
jgi:hypothetical protein